MDSWAFRREGLLGNSQPLSPGLEELPLVLVEVMAAHDRSWVRALLARWVPGGGCL